MTQDYEDEPQVDMRSPTARERDIAKCRDELLDEATVQAILHVLLRTTKKQGRLSTEDRVEIASARTQFANGNYSPGAKIMALLGEMPIDREQKRERPR